MGRRPAAERNQSPANAPASPGFELPPHYIPRVAGYARGPFMTGRVMPSEWRWRNVRTYIVTSERDGLDYRCVLVTADKTPVGYWAVEMLGTPLPLAEWMPTDD